MATYLIGYDLHEGEDYTSLEEAIKKLAPNNWWHHLDSTWIINHPGSASIIWEALEPYLLRPDDAETKTRRSGDKLLVVELTGESAWTLSFGAIAGAWIKQNL